MTAPEITPGLVLHLDPDTLLALGADCTSLSDIRVRGPHFFLCLSVSGAVSRWIPLYSRAGPGRVELAGHRVGHPKWTTQSAYFHPGQVWTASHQAVVNASVAGGDLSSRVRRNMLDGSAVPTL
jgi:hypothetical protein